VRARRCLWSVSGAVCGGAGAGRLPDGGTGLLCWLPGWCAMAFTGGTLPRKANLRLPHEPLRAKETQAGPIGSMRLQYHRGTSLVCRD
jgi:hypothetical protein